MPAGSRGALVGPWASSASQFRGSHGKQHRGRAELAGGTRGWVRLLLRCLGHRPDRLPGKDKWQKKIGNLRLYLCCCFFRVRMTARGWHNDVIYFFFFPLSNLVDPFLTLGVDEMQRSAAPSGRHLNGAGSAGLGDRTGWDEGKEKPGS